MIAQQLIIEETLTESPDERDTEKQDDREARLGLYYGSD